MLTLPLYFSHRSAQRTADVFFPFWISYQDATSNTTALGLVPLVFYINYTHPQDVLRGV